MRWPLLPVGILAQLGALLRIEAATVLTYLWPIAPIAGGLYSILRAPGSGRRLGPGA